MSSKRSGRNARDDHQNRRVESSSGNVFEDLGLPDPEMRLAKARLAQHIARLIKAQGLTQQQAADRLGIDQPKVSAILRGRLSDFAPERLIRFIVRLNQDVVISIRKPQEAGHPGVRVLASA
jgi:predicted XRE-type DNA-binding protein